MNSLCNFSFIVTEVIRTIPYIRSSYLIYHKIWCSYITICHTDSYIAFHRHSRAVSNNPHSTCLMNLTGERSTSYIQGEDSTCSVRDFSWIAICVTASAVVLFKPLYAGTNQPVLLNKWFISSRGMPLVSGKNAQKKIALVTLQTTKRRKYRQPCDAMAGLY